MGPDALDRADVVSTQVGDPRRPQLGLGQASRKEATPASVGLLLLGAYVVIAASLFAVGWFVSDAGVMAGVRAWDLDVSRWIADRRTDTWDDVVLWSGRAADTLPVIVAALVVEVVLLVRRRFALLLLVAAGLLLEVTVFLTVNYLVARPRPDVAKVGEEPGTYSFPSGHIAATVVLWGSVAFLLTRHRGKVPVVVGWCIVAIAAVVVGYSRVYRGMHHVTDVVAGALLGAVVLFIAIVTTLRVERSVEAKASTSATP